MKPSVVAFVFARGGSKGVPRKNIRLLAGKPLIAHAIATARASRWIQRVVVSTDDAEIADVALQWGAEVPFMRPAELARDDSPEWLAWRHAIHELHQRAEPLDVFVSVPTTAPLRAVDDVDACIETLLQGDADVVITVKRAERSPYFNMVVIDNGFARLVIPPSKQVFTRQSAPRVYDMTTVAYAARPQFILHANGLFEGNVKSVVVPPERALDIDTPLDFAFAEFLMQKGQAVP
jgi:N-acylneuraminate cytidylyltransferase